jgi:hypothetical protein
MAESVALSVWQGAVEAGATDISRDGFNFEGFEVLERCSTIPEDMPGSFIPLVAPNESVQVGIVSSPEGCEQMARSLMQLQKGDVMSPADMADALAEAANILAGYVKRNMQDFLNPVQLGLPLFVNGHLETSDRMRAAVTKVRMGTVDAALIVLRAAEWDPVKPRAHTN